MDASSVADDAEDALVLTVGEKIDAKNLNAAWVYGRGKADATRGAVADSAAEYGCLALGRQKGVAKGAEICAAPDTKRDVALLHYLVYQQFGFDPRTAWSPKSPLAPRWGVLANGEAGNTRITSAEGEAYEALFAALHLVCRDLAMQMAGDGEGATKLIECTVQGADTLENARTLAKSVITSSLTKAAVYGSDANWGRILCALGYAGVEFDPNDLQLYFVDESAASAGEKASAKAAAAGSGEAEEGGSPRKMLIFTDGAAAAYSEEEATQLLKKEKVTILAQFHMGNASATAWGCDLTYDYVKINADYRS